ncbi:hypothetical protein FDECE_1461 [Fusarium decemcellulare]|nr:hypothetical protein FDECE_1461 [Fusarium decemcellulare]
MSKRNCISEDAVVATEKKRRTAIDQHQTPETDSALQKANDVYTVGWICAITTEYVAAQVFLDEKHGSPEYVSPHDHNDYTLGKIGKHHVVIAVLPDGEYGTSSAATTARDMLHSFPNIKIGLMVGIGGGSPSRHDIRLGDVVVCASRDGKISVLQYDFGKTIQEQRFQTTGYLNLPPMALRTAMNGLKAQYEIEGHDLEATVNSILENKARLRKRFKRPNSESDRLYRSHVLHPPDNKASCDEVCGFDESNLVQRPERDEDENTVIHFGLIASANQLMKDALTRDALAAETDVLCFEMEAAGLMNHFPCLVIRGICDYSDSHKNKEWQGYAAMMAAAYTKDLLYRIHPSKVEAERRIGDIVVDIQDKVTGVSEDVKDLKSIQERNDILKWLSPADYAPQQSDYSSRRQEGTGQWLLSCAEFQKWVDTTKQTLFCPGIPGAGKTIASSLVIDELHTRFQKDPSIGVAYLYCDFRRRDEQNIGSMLASLLKQLAQKWHPLPEQVQKMYDRDAHLEQRPSPYDLSKALQAVSGLYSRVFIVVDALDECQVTDGCRPRLLSELFDLQETEGINIFSTSRDVPEIMEAFQGMASVEIRARDEDLHKYLVGNLNRLPSFVLKNPELQQSINDTISKAANGMFLLATLHIDSLAEQPTIGHIKKALKHLPTGLDQTYDQAMARIESQGESAREMAKQVLSWVIHARRALSPAELQHAVAVELGQTYLDTEFIPEVAIACSICAGLVTIDTQSNVVRLVHYTTQEYFDRTKERWFSCAESSITSICITYLSFDVFASGPCQTTKEFEERLKSNQLYDYAARHWGHHASRTLTLPPETVEFLRCTTKVQAASQAMMATKGRPEESINDQGVPRQMTGLHMAAHFGIADAVEILVKELDPDVKDSNGRTALWYAAARGHEALAKLLLEKGADLKAKDNDDRTPLSFATYNRNTSMVLLLLEIGLTLAINDDEYDYEQLLFAAIYGHDMAVRQLLLRGADPEWADSERRTPLSWAAQMGHLAIIDLLLQHGANPELTDSYNRTPMLWAVQKNQDAIVKRMIEHGIALEKKGTEYGQTTLSWAVVHNQMKTAKLLLEHGADLELEDNDGRTPLFWAALMGRSDMVEMLLQRGASAESRDKEGRTPLLCAAEKGHAAVVKLLVAKGVDVDCRDNEGRTPMLWAAEKRHEDILESLLDHGANPEINNLKYHRTPLIWASAKGHDRAVRILLERGADIEAKDNYGRTSLCWANRNGHKSIVNLLVENGAKST